MIIIHIALLITITEMKPSLDEANCLLNKISAHTAIIAIYRSHCFKYNVQSFLRFLNVMALSSFNNVIVTGDININISPNTFNDLS